MSNNLLAYKLYTDLTQGKTISDALQAFSHVGNSRNSTLPIEVEIPLPSPRKTRTIVERDQLGKIVHSIV